MKLETAVQYSIKSLMLAAYNISILLVQISVVWYWIYPGLVLRFLLEARVTLVIL
jgi:hypothetical protein